MEKTTIAIKDVSDIKNIIDLIENKTVAIVSKCEDTVQITVEPIQKLKEKIEHIRNTSHDNASDINTDRAKIKNR